jgi:hypothetical protein
MSLAKIAKTAKVGKDKKKSFLRNSTPFLPRVLAVLARDISGLVLTSIDWHLRKPPVELRPTTVWRMPCRPQLHAARPDRGETAIGAVDGFAVRRALSRTFLAPIIRVST